MAAKLGVIKARFKSEAKYGLLYAMFDLDRKSLMTVTVAVDVSPHIYAHRPSMYWREFESVVLSSVLEGRVMGAATASAQQKLQPLFEEAAPFLCELILQNKYLDVKEKVIQYLREALGDYSIMVDLEAAQVEVEEEKPAEEEVAEAPEAAPTQPVAGVMIDVNPVVAPVSGVPLNELADGTTVLVRLVEGTEAAKTYAPQLNAIDEEGKMLPIPATIYARRPGTQKGEIEVIFQIKEGLFGRAYVPETVKLKLATETAPRVAEQPEPSEKRRGPSVFIWILIGGLIIAGAVLAWLFISGPKGG